MERKENVLFPKDVSNSRHAFLPPLELDVPAFINGQISKKKYTPLAIQQSLNLAETIDKDHALRLQVAVSSGETKIMYMQFNEERNAIDTYLLSPDEELSSSLSLDDKLIFLKSHNTVSIGSAFTYPERVARTGPGRIFQSIHPKIQQHELRVTAGAIIDLQATKPVSASFHETSDSILDRTYGLKKEKFDGPNGEVWHTWSNKNFNFLLTSEGANYFTENSSDLRELFSLRSTPADTENSTEQDTWQHIGKGSESRVYRLRRKELAAKVYDYGYGWIKGGFTRHPLDIDDYSLAFTKRYQTVRSKFQSEVPSHIQLVPLYGAFAWNTFAMFDKERVAAYDSRFGVVGDTPKKLLASRLPSLPSTVASDVIIRPYVSGNTLHQIQQTGMYDDGTIKCKVTNQLRKQMEDAYQLYFKKLQQVDDTVEPLHHFDVTKPMVDGKMDTDREAHPGNVIIDFSQPTADAPFTLFGVDSMIYRSVAIPRAEGAWM